MEYISLSLSHSMETEEKKDVQQTEPTPEPTKPAQPKMSLGIGPAVVIGAVIIALAVIFSRGGMSANSGNGGKSKSILSTLGINEKKFQACYEAKTPEPKIRANMASAEKATKHIPEDQGRGTPYSVVITKSGAKAEIAGAYPIDAVKGILNGLLSGKTKSQSEIDIDPVTDKDHILGSKDADIVIVEYSDLECPYCSRFHATMHQVMKDYDGKVAWVFRHLPLEQLHPNAFNKAISAECVFDLGGEEKFWSYIDTIFKNAEPKKPVFDPVTGETN